MMPASHSSPAPRRASAASKRKTAEMDCVQGEDEDGDHTVITANELPNEFSSGIAYARGQAGSKFGKEFSSDTEGDGPSDTTTAPASSRAMTRSRTNTASGRRRWTIC